MKDRRILVVRTFLVSGIALLFGYLFLIGTGKKRAEAQYNVRIFIPSPKDTFRLKKSDLKITKRNGGKYIDASVTANQLSELKKEGFEVAEISGPHKNSSVPVAYRPIEVIETELHQFKRMFPKIVFLEQIGETTELGLPIWAVKISDNAFKKEDEPRILFTGVHHAREPIGASICLNLIKTLCENYGHNAQFTHWVESLEIWFVPVVNPDGYNYIIENGLRFPWWRKNLRDNDRDGVFDPLFDGVDLNRNYDYNWNEGGDGKPRSWFYRGKSPFSEKETQAIRDFAIRENFVIGISYHSYGESILFPWGNFKRPPDLELIVDIASEMASRIKRQSGRGQYAILPLNGRVGQSSIWMYGKLRIFEYIVEVGTEYFPPEENMSFILRENNKGAFYLFDRILETGIRGHVYDAITMMPLLAEVEIKEFATDYVKCRTTEPVFGRFYRIINPGYYNIEIRSEGYYPKFIKNARVQKGKYSDLEIGLYRKEDKPANGRN